MTRPSRDGSLPSAPSASMSDLPAFLVAQVLAEWFGVLVFGGPAQRDIHGVLAKIWQLEVFPQQPAVGSRVCAHAARPFWCQRLQLRHENPISGKQFLGFVIAHPIFEEFDVC